MEKRKPKALARNSMAAVSDPSANQDGPPDLAPSCTGLSPQPAQPTLPAATIAKHPKQHLRVHVPGRLHAPCRDTTLGGHMEGLAGELGPLKGHGLAPKGLPPMIHAAALVRARPEHTMEEKLYLEINEADSTCGTPPQLTQEAVRRGTLHECLGPLTPKPLSPSLLTLLDGNQDGLHKLWSPQASQALPDMRAISTHDSCPSLPAWPA
ncbi:hypothetical protein V8C86DRAFT_2515907 [Haematococcus lacustris]